MKTAALRILVITAAVLALGIGAATASDTQEFLFHWAPSPIIDDNGILHPEAVYYEVWFQRAGASEILIGTTQDTTFIVEGEPDVAQRIRVRAADSEGRMSVMSDWSDPIYFSSENNTIPGIPEGPALEQNYPNPFNPETNIAYSVPMDIATGTRVRLEIFTLQGQRVRSFDVDRSPGWHTVTWDGRDDSGLIAATGMYVTLFAVGNDVVSNKMTMLK